MKIVTVIPLKRGNFREDLTYFTNKEIANGSIVTVPIRNKEILGLVVSSEDVTDTKSGIKNMPFNLKKIIEIKDHAIFREEFFASVFETGKYFAGQKNDSVTTLIPAIFRQEYDKISQFKNSTKETEVAFKNIRNEKLLLQTPFEDRVSVYKTLIRESFARKKTLFMVLPTEQDILSFQELLSRGIENFTFIMHGGLTPKKTIDTLEKILASTHPVLILGTAPFLSIPRYDIETIIVEHENSNAYKTIARPHFDLRVFVEIFARNTGAKLIFADTLLRFETIGTAELRGFLAMHPLNFRLNFKGHIEIIDREEKEEISKKEFKVLTDQSVAEIKNSVSRRKNVFIFSLRKGLASITICKDCNEPIMCEHCSAPLVLYVSRDSKKRMFACNRCRNEASPETTCRTCGSWNLAPFGIGTDTVFEAVEKVFSPTGSSASESRHIKPKIFRLDRETVKNSKEAEKIVRNFEENPGSILIGTEMAFNYLKESVSISIVASFDSLWSVPSFKMSEKIIQLVTSIISKTKEKVIIQTKNKNDPTLLAIEEENLLSFIREELVDRKKLGYPPFKRFIKIIYVGDALQTKQVKLWLEKEFNMYNPHIFSGFISKLKGKYVTNTLIKIELGKWSSSAIFPGTSIDENLLSKITSLPREFEVFIDPEDVL